MNYSMKKSSFHGIDFKSRLSFILKAKNIFLNTAKKYFSEKLV